MSGHEDLFKPANFHSDHLYAHLVGIGGFSENINPFAQFQPMELADWYACTRYQPF